MRQAVCSREGSICTENRVEWFECCMEVVTEVYGWLYNVQMRGGWMLEMFDLLDWGLVEMGAMRDTSYSVDLGALVNIMVQLVDVS